MENHQFRIIAAGRGPAADEFEDRFFEVGYDADLRRFQREAVMLGASREEALKDAIGLAIRDVHAAGARVVRIETGLPVDLSDIAARLGLGHDVVVRAGTRSGTSDG